MQDFKHTFPELLEGLEILSSEVDALQRCLERVIAPAKIGAPARADDWTDPYAEVVRRCQKAEADADAWRTAAESALRELQDAKKPIKTDSPTLIALIETIWEFVNDPQVQGALAYGLVGNRFDALVAAFATYESPPWPPKAAAAPATPTPASSPIVIDSARVLTLADAVRAFFKAYENVRPAFAAGHWLVSPTDWADLKAALAKFDAP
jgi:hypothetical protein